MCYSAPGNYHCILINVIILITRPCSTSSFPQATGVKEAVITGPVNGDREKGAWTPCYLPRTSRSAARSLRVLKFSCVLIRGRTKSEHTLLPSCLSHTHTQKSFQQSFCAFMKSSHEKDQQDKENAAFLIKLFVMFWAFLLIKGWSPSSSEVGEEWTSLSPSQEAELQVSCKEQPRKSTKLLGDVYAVRPLCLTLKITPPFYRPLKKFLFCLVFNWESHYNIQSTGF